MVFQKLSDDQLDFYDAPALVWIQVRDAIQLLWSELTDTEIYSLWKNRFKNAPQWSRVLVSNAVSLPVDSLVFATLAFVVLPPLFGAEALPLPAALSLVMGQVIWKAIVTLISLPLIYTVKDEKLAFELSPSLAD